MKPRKKVVYKIETGGKIRLFHSYDEAVDCLLAFYTYKKIKPKYSKIRKSIKPLWVIPRHRYNFSHWMASFKLFGDKGWWK